MLFRLSQQLATKIKVGNLHGMPLDPNPYADWSCHLFTVKRTQYIILSNTQSLYSVVMSGKGITDRLRFVAEAVTHIQTFMEDDGQAFVHQRFFSPATNAATFGKALNRSVTGSINDLIRFAKYGLDEREVPPHAVGFELNDVLLSALGDGKSRPYGRPKETFKLLANGINPIGDVRRPGPEA